MARITGFEILVIEGGEIARVLARIDGVPKVIVELQVLCLQVLNRQARGEQTGG